jgi:succinylglutamic semialdehyde dehydrogenase
VLCKAASNLIIGDPRASHPVFMGPIINAAARDAALRAQADFANAGGIVLLESTAPTTPDGGYYITPGIVQVDRFVPHENSTSTKGTASAGADIEVFGPLLRVCVVDSLDAAIEQANATRYGLAASIFTHDQVATDRFLAECRAGCVNVNTGTAGASSKLPFGGLGLSGNHRPAGSFALDYCAYPVAGMIEHGSAATIPEGMRFEDSWLQ